MAPTLVVRPIERGQDMFFIFLMQEYALVSEDSESRLQNDNTPSL